MRFPKPFTLLHLHRQPEQASQLKRQQEGRIFVRVVKAKGSTRHPLTHAKALVTETNLSNGARTFVFSHLLWLLGPQVQS